LGSATVFTASVSAGTNVVYEWDFGDSQTGSGANPGHVYTNTGLYTATVTATNGRGSITNTTSVQVVDVPIVGLAAAASSPTLLGGATVFTASVSAGTSVSYHWDFGDGETGSGANPSHLYANTGLYTATVTAINGRGQATKDVVVVVEGEPQAGGTTIVSGVIYVDENANGRQEDDEPGLPDVTVSLASVEAATASTSRPTYADTTVTDASGVYTFTNVPFGDYEMTLTMPPGYKANGPTTFRLTVQPQPSNAPPLPGPSVSVHEEHRFFLPAVHTDSR
jgi:PKD repeat protein